MQSGVSGKHKESEIRNKRLVSFLLTLIEERNQAIEFLQKEECCDIAGKNFLPNRMRIFFAAKGNSHKDTELSEAKEEFVFQIEQCKFAIFLLEQKRYGEVREILLYIKKKTYESPLPLVRKKGIFLYHIREVRLYNMRCMMDCCAANA